MTTVSTRSFNDRFNTDISSLRGRAEALQASIASEQRLARSSDDPVAASRLRMLARADAAAKVDGAVAARAGTDLALTDGALQGFANSVVRIKDLALQAANGTLSADQRSAIAAELGQIGQGLFQLANSRDSAGHALFGGQASGDAYVLDAAGLAQYAGTPASEDIALGGGQTVTRGLTGPEFLHFTVAGAPTTLFAVVRDLTDAMTGGADPAQSARDALGGLDGALEAITARQTVVGARLNWIDINLDRRTAIGEQRAQEQADIGGTDLIDAVSRLQQTMTVLEASQASFARLSSLSLFQMLR